MIDVRCEVAIDEVEGPNFVNLIVESYEADERVRLVLAYSEVVGIDGQIERRQISFVANASDLLCAVANAARIG